MSDNFKKCFEKTLALEGGYKLHTVKGDRGGQTYAGIARNFWEDWEGWDRIDAGQFDDQLKSQVQAFYKKEFWDRIKGDDIASQGIAFCIYDFAVNAGVSTAVKIAQRLIGSTPDGLFGPNTLSFLNTFPDFIEKYSLRKCFYYRDICLKNPSQLTFMGGWLNRVEKGMTV